VIPRRGAGVSPPSPRETSARDARAANTATLLRLAETEADSHVRSQLASTAKRLLVAEAVDLLWLTDELRLDRPDPLEAALNRHSATFPEAGLRRSCAASAALVAALAARRCRGRWGCGTARWRRTNRWAAGPSWPRSTSADRRMARSPAENRTTPINRAGVRPR